MTQLHPEHSPDNSMTAHKGANQARTGDISINLGGATLVVMLLLSVVIGTCGIVMGLNLSRQRTLEDAFLKLDRQYRMTELKLDDWTVVAHRSGLILPGDYTRGPQGNLDIESFHTSQKSKGK